MKKIVSLLFFIAMNVMLHGAADPSMPMMEFGHVCEGSALRCFLDDPKTFDQCLSYTITDATIAQAQKELCAEFSEELKKRPKDELLKALIWACQADTPTAAKIILEAGASVNARIKNFFGPQAPQTPLGIAVATKSLELVQVLLEAGARVDLPVHDASKETPLYTSIRQGKCDIAALLLKHGANPNIPRFDRKVPLYIAAERGYTDTVALLLEHNAHPNIAENEGTTPFMMACEKGHIDVVKMLLTAGVPINQSRDDKTVPLLLAAQGGHIDTVRFILEHGADPNIVNNGKSTPLFEATVKHHSHVVEALLEYGACRDVFETYLSSPLLIATFHEDNATVYHLLNTKQKYGTSSPAPISARNSALNHPNAQGYWPLYMAALQGNTVIFKMLLDAGASLSTRVSCLDGKALSVLSALARSSADNLQEILNCCKELSDKEIKRLADVVTTDGNYPIHTACIRKNTDVLQYMLDRNVPTNVRNDAGETPYAVAQKKENHAAMQALRLDAVRSAMKNRVVLEDCIIRTI